MYNEKDVFVGFIAQGSTFEVPVDLVLNTGTQMATGVKVVATIPAGLTLVNILADQGALSGTDTWEVGTVVPRRTINAKFVFQYDDDTTNLFDIVFDLTSAGCSSCFAVKQLVVHAHVATCADCDQTVDYSIAEQNALITWHDGKPVYQRTFTGIVPDAGPSDTGFPLTTPETIVKWELRYTDGTSEKINAVDLSSANTLAQGNYEVTVGATATNVVLTVWYTKP